VTFLEKYNSEKSWHGKVLVMEIYHLAHCQQKGWSIARLAQDFQVSIGLASENLKLATLIHTTPTILHARSRQEALKKAKNI
jgi:hypothetical protein